MFFLQKQFINFIKWDTKQQRKSLHTSYIDVKNGPFLASLSFIFGLFKQTLQFLQQINVKNVHPVYSAEIQTHDPQNISLLPLRCTLYSIKPNTKIYLANSWLGAPPSK